MKYMPRIVDEELKLALDRACAVYVRGPKWCGKTSSCEQLAKSTLKMRDPDSYAANMETAQVKPSLLLRGSRPRLIDEWQVAPVLWDAVINDADNNGGIPGQFLLTGSATPVDLTENAAPKHAGTGRITRVDMDPMTLYEAKLSSSEVSLEKMFAGRYTEETTNELACNPIDGPENNTSEPASTSANKPASKLAHELAGNPIDEPADPASESVNESAAAPTKSPPAQSIEGSSNITVEDYAELICCGGWPAPIAQKKRDFSIAADYVKSLCESDILQETEHALDPVRAHALLRSLGRNTAQGVSSKTILTDVQNAGVGMSAPTLRTYLNAFRRLFVLEDVAAWAPTLRSKTPLRSASVLHLCDPSLACAAMETSPDGLLSDMNTFGYLFESLCVRDLRVYMRRLGGGIFHYRDKTGLEVDAILRLKNSTWAGVEIKLGGQKNIEEAATNLLKLTQKVDTQKSGSPKFLMVLTGGKYAYTRPDGVHVVPLGCLAP